MGSVGRVSQIVTAALVAASFWIFARFTVDDAFITWRYGLNLVHQGVWNYNPTTFDLTQSYTNPIFALMSIVPALLGIDPVPFFKACALLFMLGSYVVLARPLDTFGKLSLGLFMAAPATMVHAFAGLETFLFVVLLAWLLIAAYELDKAKTYVLAVVLMFVRPESWILPVLLPLYFQFSRWASVTEALGSLKSPKALKHLLFEMVALLVPLAVFLGLNSLYFGATMPNAFYIKVASSISFGSLTLYGAYASPLLVLVVLKQRALFILSALIFAAMAFNYARSELMMDYASRFAFHIVAPISLLLIHVCFRGAASMDGEPATPTKLRYVPLVLLAVFSLISARSTLGTTLYYPKLLNAHSALGRALKSDLATQGNKVISVADAGAVPYLAEAVNLDYIGLGSKLIALHGLQADTLEAYKPAVVVVYVDDAGRYVEARNQGTMLNWISSNRIPLLCDVRWSKKSSLRVYSALPLVASRHACETSAQQNEAIDAAGFIANLKLPPWAYWTS